MLYLLSTKPTTTTIYYYSLLVDFSAKKLVESLEGASQCLK